MSHPLPSRFDQAALQQALAALPGHDEPVDQLRHLVSQKLDELPLPGHGATLDRWRALAAVAAHDLSLAKLYEGHTDALAILTELGHSALHTPTSLWGIWAAEAPQGRSVLSMTGTAGPRLSGAKLWCSGAAAVTHGLLTAWRPNEALPQLVSLVMNQPGVDVLPQAWKAIGMAGSTSIDLRFKAVAVTLVGQPGNYLSRPGFWQGGAGVAACWYGGAQAVARHLRNAVSHTPADQRNGFRLAALGKVDLRLQQTAAVLRAAAEWIDTHPLSNAQTVATRARLSAEACATAVLDEVGRALGAGPYCRDVSFARLAADLPVFVRQSHAEKDFAALGACLAEPTEGTSWNL